MPLYRYQAVDGNGEVLKDQMTADSEGMVVDRLRDQGLMPLAVEESSGGALRLSMALGTGAAARLSQKQVGVITQQLARLLKAGLPLDRAFTILVGVGDDERVKGVLRDVQEEVRGGKSLADALEASGAFSRFYLNMVRAGEAGGSLEVVLERLSEFLERSKALRESVTSALIYPTILLLVAALSIILLLTFVVPQFQQLFDDAGKALPLATQIVIAVGEGLRDYWWAGGGALIVLTLVVRIQLARPPVRRQWDALLLRLPLVGDLVARVEMARFSRTLGTLMGNGVPMLTALSIVKETLSNQVMAEAAASVAENLKAGQGLADPLAETEAFPSLAVHMIRVGEETGELQDMLLQVADTYDGEVQAAIKRMLTLLEPVLILGLGVVIAGIILSIMVAILGINELAF
ncbi:MAG: type II secretion system F family protein [Candidatus Competibacterales bacterium]